jgi:hypothetical protein
VRAATDPGGALLVPVEGSYHGDLLVLGAFLLVFLVLMGGALVYRDRRA